MIHLERVLRQLPALDLAGCRAPHVQQARAAFNRGRVVSALGGRLMLPDRRALLSLLGSENGAARRVRWWCEHARVQAQAVLWHTITLLCATE